MRGRRFSALGAGRVKARLSGGEVQLLQEVARVISGVLHTRDRAHERLFPPAYRDDPEAEQQWAAMAHQDLAEQRRRTVEEVLSSLERGRWRGDRWEASLTEEEVASWLAVLNDGRLTLGVHLEVTEEMHENPPAHGDPNRRPFEIYSYLGWLESELLDALDPGLLEDVERQQQP